MAPNSSEDLYQVLGIQRTASAKQITSAYRTLAKKYHPDKPDGDAEMFKRINHAHEILSDPEKRSVYDRYGEEGLERGGPQDPSDFISSLIRPANKPQKRKTKDVVHVLPVTLESMYSGRTKKMAVRRKVVDQESCVNTCAACNGDGMKVEVVRRGGLIQQVSAPCTSCDATGKIFKQRQSREELEVHIQKGAMDGQKITFREKADELPGADTGDVVFVLNQQAHPEFKRKGADLYIERTISLVEALCGFELEVTHLDGRKLLIKSLPGDVVKPMKGNPLEASDEQQAWERFENMDCPSITTVAEAGTVDVEQLKQEYVEQLRRRGLDIQAFVVDHKNGKTYFKSAKESGGRDEVLAAQEPKQNCTMYVVGDPHAESQLRMMKAVKGEGMPTLKNPFVHGNLFIILGIEFPDKLSLDAMDQIRGLLPPPLNEPQQIEDSADVEVHTLADIDPVQSQASNKANMTVGGEAYDEDEEARTGPGQPQCAQM